MMMDKALVRRLSACETMGSATTICSDKTGTLTLNQMTIVEAYSGGQKIDPPDSKSQLPPILYSLLIEGIAQNTTGSVFVPEGGGDLEISGSPTEKAILGWAVKLGMNFDAVRSESSIIHVFPFNSEKKKGGVALQLPDSQVHIHWKGAAEIVLASCTEYIDASGNIVPLDQVKVSFFRNAIEDMAANEQQKTQWALPQDDLVLLAIVGIKDPCRPGVRDAVRLCQNAGVKVRMVTGDNPQTAKAIALECGILSSAEDAVEPYVIEGRVFRNYSDAEREKIAEKILADIGLSMGIQGTEVAKESSDIIILDDNFASVVKPEQCPAFCYNLMKRILYLENLELLGTVDTMLGKEPLITNIMWRNLLIQAAYQVSVLLVLNFRGRSLLGLEHETPQRANNVKNTLIFNAFVFCQIFNEFNARKPDEFNVFKGITKNHLFIAIVGITLVLQVIIIEFVGKFTSTVRLNWKQWLISAVIAFISWPLAAVGKLIPVPQTPLHKFFTRIFHRSARSPSKNHSPACSSSLS
ncbi:hypothetical protein OIU77_029958 [Salix suchowensis]|uniref:Cation-transporting P-type ATPase C-terminal domain-containing protein n=1 Tax=Salix suchowensis TaxID=1278906 RepID=A0ABQ9BAD0_9ROSI|nr:hypothetical protein OIU77_029958 [Salix suchowensis]